MQRLVDGLEFDKNASAKLPNRATCTIAIQRCLSVAAAWEICF